jgi:hypothetical protein
MLPPSVLICHWKVGAGVPLAAAVNVTEAPVTTVWLAGCVVIVGATVAALTVKTAPLLVAEPAELVATSVYVPASLVAALAIV